MRCTLLWRVQKCLAVCVKLRGEVDFCEDKSCGNSKQGRARLGLSCPVEKWKFGRCPPLESSGPYYLITCLTLKWKWRISHQREIDKSLDVLRPERDRAFDILTWLLRRAGKAPQRPKSHQSQFQFWRRKKPLRSIWQKNKKMKHETTFVKWYGDNLIIFFVSRRSSCAQWTTAAWCPRSSGSTPPRTTSPSPWSRCCLLEKILLTIFLMFKLHSHM